MALTLKKAWLAALLLANINSGCKSNPLSPGVADTPIDWSYGDGWRTNGLRFESVAGLRVDAPDGWVIRPEAEMPIVSRQRHLSELAMFDRVTHTKVYISVTPLPRRIPLNAQNRAALQVAPLSTAFGQFPFVRGLCEEYCMDAQGDAGDHAIGFLIVLGFNDLQDKDDRVRALLATTPQRLSDEERSALIEDLQLHPVDQCYFGARWHAREFFDAPHGVRWMAPSQGVWRGRVGAHANDMEVDINLWCSGNDTAGQGHFEDLLSGIRVLVCSSTPADREAMEFGALAGTGTGAIVRGATWARTTSGSRDEQYILTDHREVVAVNDDVVVHLHVWGPSGSLERHQRLFDDVTAGLSFVSKTEADCADTD